MNPSSLSSLILLRLPFQQALEVCSSEQFPPCTGLWKKKAELEFGFSGNFFDLYLGAPLSTPRSIPESYRYLELGTINSFLPESAVSQDRKTGQITGLFESFIGVKEAVMQGNLGQFQFFFSRMKPETKEQLKEMASSLTQLSSLFPRGANLISFPVFDALVQNLGLSSLEKINQPQNQTQQWILAGKPPNSIDRSLNDQKARMGGFSFEEILTNPLYFSNDVLLSLIERGDERALKELLLAFENGTNLPDLRRIFGAILRSGRIDFVGAFEPYFKYVVSRSISYDNNGPVENVVGFPMIYFFNAAYGGNQQVIDLLSQFNQKSPLDIIRNDRSFANSYLRSILDGFFLHGDVVAVRSLIEQIPFRSSGIISQINFSSLPIDILDLIYHKIPFDKFYSPVDFLSKILVQNLGYLNIVTFCLAGLDSERNKEYFFPDLKHSGLERDLEKHEKLTPMSVSIVRSALDSWKASILPPLVENN